MSTEMIPIPTQTVAYFHKLAIKHNTPLAKYITQVLNAHLLELGDDMHTKHKMDPILQRILDTVPAVLTHIKTLPHAERAEHAEKLIKVLQANNALFRTAVKNHQIDRKTYQTMSAKVWGVRMNALEFLSNVERNKAMQALSQPKAPTN